MPACRRAPLRPIVAAFATTLAACFAPAAAAQDAPHQALARDIFRELVEADTVTASGDTLAAAQAMAARLLAAGFPAADVQVLSPGPRKGNLVARLRGTGTRRPMLLLAHLDVVEALPSDWSVDPFRLTERDGYFYGRGTSDDKFMAAAFVANLIRYRQEGYRPERDLIVVLETDEEILDARRQGIRWLLAHHRPLIDAEFALNEGGNVAMIDGRPVANALQTSEKVSASFELTARNPGGHSSQPRPDNAIYQLAAGLSRLAGHAFPVRLNETTRAFLERSAGQRDPQTAADMRALAAGRADDAAVARLTRQTSLNAILRTTCVATMLDGGHAVNALPQTARARVNCRMLPDEQPDDVRAALVAAVGDPEIEVRQTSRAITSPPSPLNPEILRAAERLTAEFWPGAPVIPTLLAAATDGSHLRNAGIPTYGHSGLASNANDVRAHGRDERVPVRSFYQGLEYLYRLVRDLSGPAPHD